MRTIAMKTQSGTFHTVSRTRSLAAMQRPVREEDERYSDLDEVYSEQAVEVPTPLGFGSHVEH